MNVLISRRGLIKASLTRCETFANSLDDRVDMSTSIIETRIEKLNEIWDSYAIVQNSMCEFVDDDDYVDQTNEINSFEEKYFETKAKLVDYLKKKSLETTTATGFSDNSSFQTLVSQQTNFLEQISNKNSELLNQIVTQQTRVLEEISYTKNTSSSSIESGNELNLPKIKLPMFSGDYKEWISFRDLFTGSIHNSKNLSKTQKFQYLKGYLKDEALGLLRHTPVSDANYDEAWEKLNKRYNKPSQILKSYIQSFLSLNSINSPSASALRKITDASDETIRALKALGTYAESRDPWIIYILLNKMDSDTKQQWAEKTSQNFEPTLIEFFEFLDTRCAALDSLSSGQKTQNQPQPQKPYKFTKSFSTSSKTKTILHCPHCNEEHFISNCAKFRALTVEAKRSFVLEKRLCFNCLRSGHSSGKCVSQHSCRTCGGKHHTLLHLSKPTQSNAHSHCTQIASSSPGNETETINDQVNIYLSQSCIQNSNSLLPTALINVKNCLGELITCRMLLDSGSQVSFISESCVKRLGLSRRNGRLNVNGISTSSGGATRGLVTLKVYSRINSFSMDINAYILSKLTSSLPANSINTSDWSYISNLELADPQFHKSSCIDIIAGANVFFKILEPSKICIKNHPVAQSTMFGWILAGDLPLFQCTDNVVSCCSITDVDKLLQKFWEVEEIPNKIPNTHEEIIAEDNFIKNFTRHVDGRYVVKLPFKSGSIKLGNSLNMAINRMLAMEKRFSKNSRFKEMYSQFMNEYISMHHMEEIHENDLTLNSNQIYYLPHHAVLKEDSTTTKLRVVFDGSVKSSSGESLNDLLLPGPKLLKDVFTVCLRFRIHKLVFTADIEKMFRMIWVDKQDCDFQRVVWRESPDQSLKHYRLKTVTYGTTSAPFLANRVLKQLAIDYQNTYPLASKVILNDIYVDDVMSGTDTVDEILNLKQQLLDVLKLGGFNLRKWTTNCWPLLQSLPSEYRELDPVDIQDDSKLFKVLGLQWQPAGDFFTYKVKLPEHSKPTKRSILSDSARLFDPHGYLAPTIVMAKITFQSLWLQKLDWDDEIPENICKRWLNIRNELKLLEKIKVTRKLWANPNNMEFHGFCDASELAYAAVIYCRSIDISNKVHISIVAAKSRVAPIKQRSIPRLELDGAVLLTRLYVAVKEALQLSNYPFYAWTDSEIVLAYLSSPPRRWKTYVANRVSEILDTLPRNCWNHVRSEHNPADCASRGLLPSNLIYNELWWNGAPFLTYNINEYIKNSKVNIGQKTSKLIENEKRLKCVDSLVVSTTNSSLEYLTNKFNNWFKIKRIVAFCIRFFENCKLKIKQYGSLKTFELEKSEIILILWTQNNAFKEDIKNIKFNKSRVSNKLSKLSPFLDKNGLLRVGGRIEHSHLSFNQKHPIILPKGHIISIIIIKHFHNTYLHAGVAHLFTILRQRYWILGCRNMLRKVVFECISCFRERQTTATQFMSNLPQQRIQICQPFERTGVDLAGPLTLRMFRGRKPRFCKGYITLFVCFVTKAIHLELVSDLTADAFIAALRRFVARRGKCADIFCDNGTNFHGASRKLTEMHKHLVNKNTKLKIEEHCAKDNIRWHFIPPVSPHFGGMWEAGVKSVKLHLKRVIGNQILTFEEMYTLLTQIEALLNSRPLCPINDFEINPLTPSHFLIGRPYTTVPETDLTMSTICPRENWKLIQLLVQGFWKRWSNEYITSLQNRPKWKGVNNNVKEGSLVVLKDNNLPPSKWSLGQVVKCYPGQDGLVRVVTVKTTKGEFNRPIVKLAILPSC